jgi:hypothetical protein
MMQGSGISTTPIASHHNKRVMVEVRDEDFPEVLPEDCFYHNNPTLYEEFKQGLKKTGVDAANLVPDNLAIEEGCRNGRHQYILCRLSSAN